MSVSTSALAVPEQVMAETAVELLNSVDDPHGGVCVDMKEPMDPKVFSTALKASISHWRLQVRILRCSLDGWSAPILFILT